VSDVILAILAETRGTVECLDAARTAAVALAQAELVVLHVRPDPRTTILPTEEILTPRRRTALTLEAVSEAAKLRRLLAQWRAHNRQNISVVWRDVAGDIEAEVTRHGQAAALIVMVGPGPHSRGHAHDAFHAALFNSDRPLLRAPPDAQARAPRRITIGWKESDVCRRAIAAAVPWLKQAESIEVLHVVARDPAELAAAAELLARLGLQANCHPLVRGATPVGEQLLAEAAAQGADWLVIGAYSRPPLAERVFGGVTRVVLSAARLPVFMLY
jgi:nucleotide-binding universal stress UspA family protein